LGEKIKSARNGIKRPGVGRASKQTIPQVFVGYLANGVAMYALFEKEKQIGSRFPTEKEVWEAALIEGLVMDVPIADEQGGQIIPAGYHVEKVE
jgi:hypothetical protein